VLFCDQRSSLLSRIVIVIITAGSRRHRSEE
jgi:hypothetical protein